LAYVDTDTRAYRYCDTDTHTDCDPANGDPCADSYGSTDAHANCYTGTHGYGSTDTYTDCDPANSDTGTHSNGSTDTYARTYANGDSYASTWCDFRYQMGHEWHGRRAVRLAAWCRGGIRRQRLCCGHKQQPHPEVHL
jgi:hypothetical protein